jgi:hypothetical protein
MLIIIVRTNLKNNLGKDMGPRVTKLIIFIKITMFFFYY